MQGDSISEICTIIQDYQDHMQGNIEIIIILKFQNLIFVPPLLKVAVTHSKPPSAVSS